MERKEIKPYWTTRLFESDGSKKKYEYILFKNGYSKEAPEMKVELLDVRIREDYELVLGKVWDTKNIEGFKD